jgi:lysophospholipase L1-like esterase
MGEATYALLLAFGSVLLHSGWSRGWLSALADGNRVPVHVVVLSDSTARVDQTNGVGYGPDSRADLWPNQLATALEKSAPGGAHGTGLLALEGNAGRFDTDIWHLSGNYSFLPLIGPYQTVLSLGGRVPANGGTVSISGPETATMADQSGDTLWVYWASCPDSRGFEVAVDGKIQGKFGDAPSPSCTAHRTKVFSGKAGRHTSAVTVPSGKAYLYAAEWTQGNGGIELDNLAIGGATSSFYAGSNKLAYLHTIPNIGLVIVAIGINDFLHDTSLVDYRANLSSILNDISRNEPHASVLLVSPYTVVADDHRNELDILQSRYWETAEQVAEQKHVGYISLGRVFHSYAAESSAGLLTSDTVHPSDAGGKLIAAALGRVILPKPVDSASAPASGKIPDDMGLTQ